MAASSALASLLLIATAVQAVPVMYPGVAQAYYPMAYAPIEPYYGAAGAGASEAAWGPGPGVPRGDRLYAAGVVRPVVEGGAGHEAFAAGDGFRSVGGYAGGAAQLANKGFHAVGAYAGDDRHVGDKLAHSGYASAYGGGRQQAHDGGLYAREEEYGRGGKLNAEQAAKNGFKKGHQSSGFQTSYHKDETGHNTRFYDDDHDEGLHVGARGFGDYFGARGLASAHQNAGQGAFHAGHQGQQQHYGTGLHADAQSGQHKAHADQSFFGRNEGFGHGHRGLSSTGGGGSFGKAHSAYGGLGYPY